MKSGVYCRTRGGGTERYEPRFKPPRETLSSGKPLIQNYLPLGGYGTRKDAESVRQIAAFYYGKAEPYLDLGDGRPFAIDSSWNEHLDFRRGKEKAKWVASKAKEVFQNFKEEKASSGLLNVSNSHTSVIPSGEQIAEARDSSQSGSSSPVIYKNSEHRASSSRATLPVASNPDEQWFAEAVVDEGDGAVKKQLSGDVEYFPRRSPSPVTWDFIEPTFSPPGLLEYPELDLSEKQSFENHDSWLDDIFRCPPDSILNANGHPQCSAVNATADELCASLFEPREPSSPRVEVTNLKENQGSYVESAIPAKTSLETTTVPVEGALPTSVGLQVGVDVGAPLSDPSLGSEPSIKHQLLTALSLYQQKCENYKRRISELRREVKRLKRKSPMSFDA